MQRSAKNNSNLNENKQQNEVLANAVKKMANPSDFTPQLLLDMQILNENLQHCKRTNFALEQKRYRY